MTDSPTPANNTQSSRRVTDMAILAPLIGLLLLTPPIISLFASDRTVFGSPLVLMYLFFVWFGLIVLAALLSRKLRRQSDAQSPPP